MRKVAFVFPGQGATIGASADDWRTESADARMLLDAAEDEAAQGRGGPPARLDALDDAASFQPRLTALCLAVHRALVVRGIAPDIVAGHSLGEVAACAAAGCIDPITAVAIAGLRGRLMARQARLHPGGMLALATPDRGTADDLVAHARAHGLASVAAHNAPDQWVVSGEWSALRTIAARMETMPVPVAGPWHTEAMADAVDEYRDALLAAVTMPLRIPIVCNRTGDIVSSAEEIPDVLALQLTRPVMWVEAVATLERSGVTAIVAIGPAKALRSLVRRGLQRQVPIHAAESPSDLDRIAEALAQ